MILVKYVDRCVDHCKPQAAWWFAKNLLRRIWYGRPSFNVARYREMEEFGRASGFLHKGPYRSYIPNW